MITWETARAANGPAVVAYLESADLLTAYAEETFERRLKGWRAGKQARFLALDELLTVCGVHPSVLPVEVWEAPAWGPAAKQAVTA